MIRRLSKLLFLLICGAWSCMGPRPLTGHDEGVSRCVRHRTVQAEQLRTLRHSAKGRGLKIAHGQHEIPQRRVRLRDVSVCMLVIGH